MYPLNPSEQLYFNLADMRFIPEFIEEDLFTPYTNTPCGTRVHGRSIPLKMFDANTADSTGRVYRHYSPLSELATTASNTLKDVTSASLDFLSLVPAKLQSFYSENKEQILRAAKLVAGATIITLFASTLPSLIMSVASLTLAAFANNLALFFAISKVTISSAAILLGLGLLFSSPAQADNKTPPS